MVVIVIGITIITFLLTRLIPADPVITFLGPHAREEQIEGMRRKWGFDKPLHVQYILYIVGLLHGDWGVSVRTQHPVLSDLLINLPFTLELATSAIFLVVLISIPLGIVSAVKKDTFLDHFFRLFAVIGSSMPVFWIGLLSLALFYFKLGWVPAPGVLSAIPPKAITGSYLVDSILTVNLSAFMDTLSHLFLPSFVLALYFIAMDTRIVRSSMLEVLDQDYIRTARAKGLHETIIIYKHALKNAFIPIITVIGLQYGGILAGAIVTETVFSRPGLGTYAIGSMLFMDYPAIVGVTMIISVAFVIVNFITDMIYMLVDPKIRYG